MNLRKEYHSLDGVRASIINSGSNALDKQEHGKIVFLGDSLTEFCQWNELLKNNDVVNRGVGGDTTKNVLIRLDSILQSKPKKILIMIGINDIMTGADITVILDNYNKIINSIKEKTPDTKIIIQNILPITNISNHESKNIYIKEINQSISKIAKDNNIEYIDINEKLIAKDGQLNKDFTIDGIHLNAQGYDIWKQTIERYVNTQ